MDGITIVPLFIYRRNLYNRGVDVNGSNQYSLRALIQETTAAADHSDGSSAALEAPACAECAKVALTSTCTTVRSVTFYNVHGC